MFILSLVICFAGAMLSLVRQYQMLQQNSYFASRYLGWIKGNTAILLLVLRLFLIGLAIFGAFVGENALKGSMLLFAACGLFIGWSGLSVHFQIISLCDGYDLSFKKYFAFKAIQGLICCFLSLIAFKF